LLFFFDAGDVNKKEAFEPGAHLLTLTERVEADNKVEANVEVRLVVHDVLVYFDSLAESFLLNQSETNVLLDLKFHLFVVRRSGIESHVVHLDGLIVLLLLEENVSHVHAEAGSLGVLLVLQDNSVRVKGLLMESVDVIHVSQVVEDVEGQVDVDLVKAASCFTEVSNFTLLRCGVLCLGEGIVFVLFNLGLCTLFK